MNGPGPLDTEGSRPHTGLMTETRSYTQPYDEEFIADEVRYLTPCAV